MKTIFYSSLLALLITTSSLGNTEASKVQDVALTEHAVITLTEPELAKLTEALHADKWDKLIACIPSLQKGENPFLAHPEYQITIGELVILTRSWDCLKNMLRCGLDASEKMIQLSGEMGNARTYGQLMDSNPIMTAEQPLRFSGELLELALERGADANARSKGEEKRPLMTHTLLSDIQLLVKKGADVNATDRFGRTAIFYHADPEILSYLIAEGADLKHLDAQGHSALDYWGENKERSELLSKAGALPVKSIALVKIAYHEGYEVMLNDVDNYGYLIIREKEEGKIVDNVIFYLASRFPTPHVRQTENWHEFVAWLRAMPPHSTIHSYVRCQHHFTSNENWLKVYELDDIISQVPIYEGEERVFCNCEDDKEAAATKVE